MFYRNTRNPKTGCFEMAEWSERGTGFAVTFHEADGTNTTYDEKDHRWEFAPIKVTPRGVSYFFHRQESHVDMPVDPDEARKLELLAIAEDNT